MLLQCLATRTDWPVTRLSLSIAIHQRRLRRAGENSHPHLSDCAVWSGYLLTELLVRSTSWFVDGNKQVFGRNFKPPRKFIVNQKALNTSSLLCSCTLEMRSKEPCCCLSLAGKCRRVSTFANDMARCVVVVGLPYPDITDPELKEKMSALDASPDKTITGQAYYQNLCMRAVNQSVGRAIRHANDYAAIVLIDRRYTSDSRIWAGLPSWLKKGSGSQWRQDLPLSSYLAEMQAFFESKK